MLLDMIFALEVFDDLVHRKRGGCILHRTHLVATGILDRYGPEMLMFIVPGSYLQIRTGSDK